MWAMRSVYLSMSVTVETVLTFILLKAQCA